MADDSFPHLVVFYPKYKSFLSLKFGATVVELYGLLYENYI